MDSALPPVQPLSGRWQVSHDILPSLESLVSKNSIFPRAIFSGVLGLSPGTFIGPSAVGSSITVGASGTSAVVSAAGGSDGLQDAPISRSAYRTIDPCFIDILRCFSPEL